MRLAGLVTALFALLALPRLAAAQCATDDDCRYGRVCQDGQCTYQTTPCERDVDCAEGSICESNRCTVAAPAAAATAASREPVLPPPRPAVIRGLRPQRTDGGAIFVDPIEWGGRGAISPRPHGTSVFDFQYGNGKIPCLSSDPTCCDADGMGSVNSAQLLLGGESLIGNIVSIGFSMALFRWLGLDACDYQDFALGDIQMRLGVLAYHRSGANTWFGLSPFLRILMAPGTSGLGASSGYYAILEPGIALGYAWRLLSVSLHVSGLVGFLYEGTFGGFLSHLTVGVRPINLLGIIADLEVGYGTAADQGAVPVAVLIGLRLYLGQSVALDVSSRIAATEVARYSDVNAAVGLWSLGLKLSIVWRGLGRP
jgi:hypothetical protein